MAKTELSVYSTFRSVLGGSTPIKTNCAGCTKKCSKAGIINDYSEVEKLLPPGMVKSEPKEEEKQPGFPPMFVGDGWQPSFEREEKNDETPSDILYPIGL